MAKIVLKLRFDSPAFVNGSDPKGSPEHRAASIRGQLRYWARAIIGAQMASLEELWKRESATFGSTGAGSPVTVRISAEQSKVQRHHMLPHLEKSGKAHSADAIDIGSRFDLELITRPGIRFPPLFKKSLRVWLVLGGVGKRSRRTFGAVWCEEWNDKMLGEVPIQTINEYMEYSKRVLEDAVGNQSELGSVYSNNIPPFPTLNPAHSQVIICKHSFNSAKAANVALFRDLLCTNKFKNKPVFGYALPRDRLASPLIAQVRMFKGKYYLVLTAMRSDSTSKKKEADRINWNDLRDFLKEAKTMWDGEVIWGNLA